MTRLSEGLSKTTVLTMTSDGKLTPETQSMFHRAIQADRRAQKIGFVLGGKINRPKFDRQAIDPRCLGCKRIEGCEASHHLPEDPKTSRQSYDCYV